MYKAVKKAGQFAAWVLGGLLGLVFILALVAALVARPGDATLYPAPDEVDTVEVRIVRNWLHANIAVPREALMDADDGPPRRALSRLPDGEWVTIGWGEADHYRGRGDSPARRLSLFRSLLIPQNPAVVMMEANARGPSPESTGREVMTLRLSKPGFARLVERLDRTYRLDDGRPRVAGRGRDPASLFFYSREHSDIRFACNHWIAELLDAAGVPTNPLLATITFGLVSDLRMRAGGKDMLGETTSETDPGEETPPAHVGRFEPISADAHRLGTARFEAYRIEFETGHAQTDAVRLEPASRGGVGRASWATLMDVPADSLVERRAVLTDPGLCADARADTLMVGFRVSSSERYRLVMLPMADGRACGRLTYLQP